MMRRLIKCALFLLFAVEASPSEDREPTLEIETIVRRMGEARAKNQDTLRPYTLKRQYTLVGKNAQKTEAKVLALITFTPPSTKEFAIQERSGTRFGERAVRQMLENETAIVKNHETTELSLANYEFSLVGEDLCNARRCYVITLTPRRKDKTLLAGRIWVDAETYLLHRMEGAPAKALSWWLRNSSIVLTYRDVSGMWLQTASESKADVRFVGRYTMFSRDVEYVVSK